MILVNSASSLSAPRPWRDVSRWYGGSKRYWASTEPSNDGVLGGYGSVHASDISDSRAFLRSCGMWPPRDAGRTRALDVGAGIGRITDGLLLDLCDQVDLVDGCADFVAQARATLQATPSVDGRGQLGVCMVADLQDFQPAANARYDLIWIQWVVGHLTDDDLCKLLRRCVRSLTSEGLIVLKDNVLDEAQGAAWGQHRAKSADTDRMVVDSLDNSVIRTRPHLMRLVAAAGLQLVASAEAELDCDELQAVTNLALRPEPALPL